MVSHPPTNNVILISSGCCHFAVHEWVIPDSGVIDGNGRRGRLFAQRLDIQGVNDGTAQAEWSLLGKNETGLQHYNLLSK